MPTDPRKLVPGIGPGDYLPLTIDEICKGYGALLGALEGSALAEGDYPPMYRDADTGEVARMKDTPSNRAWYLTAKTIEDEDRRISLLKRLEMASPFLNDDRYSKYVGRGTMHIAMIATIARLRFSIRTPKKALRVAFDAEFKRQMAATVDPGRRSRPS